MDKRTEVPHRRLLLFAVTCSFSLVLQSRHHRTARVRASEKVLRIRRELGLLLGHCDVVGFRAAYTIGNADVTGLTASVLSKVGTVDLLPKSLVGDNDAPYRMFGASWANDERASTTIPYPHERFERLAFDARNSRCSCYTAEGGEEPAGIKRLRRSGLRSFTLASELMLVGDVLAYIDIFSVILLMSWRRVYLTYIKGSSSGVQVVEIGYHPRVSSTAPRLMTKDIGPAVSARCAGAALQPIFERAG